MKAEDKILIVYEEIPDETTIVLVNDQDLTAVKLTREEIASIHGTYVNNSELTAAQEEIHTKLSEAIKGVWNEDTNESNTAIWESKILSLDPEKPPAQTQLNGLLTVIHTGFML